MPTGQICWAFIGANARMSSGSKVKRRDILVERFTVDMGASRLG